jgi:hypothetical protein
MFEQKKQIHIPKMQKCLFKVKQNAISIKQ